MNFQISVMDSTAATTNEQQPEAPEITREEWYEWKTTTFGDAYHIWHDGLCVSLVTSLEGEEREKALVMLQRGLDLGDSDSGTALAAMEGIHARDPQS
jgi:hypothetical protein